MRKAKLKSMMDTARDLFAEEHKKFNGITMKFCFCKDTETGETLYFVPNKTDAEDVKSVMDMHFGTSNHERE